MLDSDGNGTLDTPENEYWGCAPWSDPTNFAPVDGKLGGFRVMLEEKLRARLSRQAKPANVH